MKRYITFLTIALALAASCAKQQPTGEKYLPAEPLKVSTGTIQFDAAGGDSYVSVTTSAAVEASADKDWVTVNVDGKEVDLSVTANESIETRYAVVTVKSDSKSRNVQIIQFGINTKLLWEEVYEFPAAGGSVSLLYETASTVRVSVEEDWISASALDGVLSITVAQNTEGEEREGSVIWKAGSETRTVAIKQAAGSGGGGGENPPAGGVIFSEDFENIDALGEWMILDADGDGNNWGYADNLAAHSGIANMISASYSNETGPLTPDNWLFTPAINIVAGSWLSFWVTGQDQSYQNEHFGAYITDTEPASAADLEACTKLIEATIPNGNPIQEETVSDHKYLRYAVQIPDSFAGKACYIAIRHFDCTDMFVLNLDDLMVTVGQPAASSAPSTQSVVPMQGLHYFQPVVMDAKRK